MRPFRNLLFTTTALVPLGLVPASANPLGAQVVGGTATVQGQGTAAVTVTQSSDKAIINWNTFNIANGETTRFIQPSASSVALNRVTGGLGPSQIFGTLSANGRVFLVNPDGILFGPNSKIDTAGFLATTNNIKNDDFMAGRYNFTLPGRPDASIINQGTITAQTGGFAALVAPGVRNSGTITARLGTIGLGASNGFMLDFYGDKLITLGVGDAIATQVKDVATGQTLDALVKNEGTLKANGGRVELTAAAARQVVDAVINNTGRIEAHSVEQQNGMVVLGAPTAGTKPSDAPTQTVRVSGSISASGKRKGTSGGTIQVTGESIAVAAAKLDATGRVGGGKVLIGGDIGGGKPSPLVSSLAGAKLQNSPVSNASRVAIDAATMIDASAKTAGDGGKVVVWSDEATVFLGTIHARGGKTAGDGGFVEVSGHQTLTFSGRVDAGADNGRSGTLLLDPTDVTITDPSFIGTGFTSGSFSGVNPTTFTPFPDFGFLLNSDLTTTLATNNVVVTTNSGFFDTQPGNITVAAALNWPSANTLTLNAANNIAINAPITAANGGLTLSAGFNGTITDTANLAVKRFTLQSGAWTQIGTPLPTFSATDFRVTGGSFLRALGGDGSTTAPYQIADAFQLQQMRFSSGCPPALPCQGSNYVLANDINAAVAVNWNGNLGFASIQAGGPGLTGTFDGQNHVVNGLRTSLFANIGPGVAVSNLGLTNVNINKPNATVGALASVNLGTVTGLYATGTVTTSGFGEAGGLVGVNGGTISKSYATVEVTGRSAGGLVGTNMGASVISQSFATGAVSGTSAVGGLVGTNGVTQGAIITQSYATGSATGIQENSFNTFVGGLVGDNNGSITQSYATGFVSGYPPVTNGGFLTGQVSVIGGLTGTSRRPDFGIVLSSNYWDIQTTGQSVGVSDFGQPIPVTVGVGMTTAQLKSGLPAGFNTEPLPLPRLDPLSPPVVEQSWAIGDGVNSGYPYLKWQVPTTPGVTTTPPTVDQVLAATLAQLSNQNSSISKSDSLPQKNTDTGTSPLISNEALDKLRMEMTSLRASSSLHAQTTTEANENVFRQVLLSPTTWESAEALYSLYEMSQKLNSLAPSTLVSTLTRLGIADTSTLRDLQLQLAGKMTLEAGTKLIFGILTDKAIDSLLAQGVNIPRPVLESLAKTLFNAATLNVKGQVVDQTFLIIKEATALNKDSSSLVQMFSQQGSENLKLMQQAIELRASGIPANIERADRLTNLASSSLSTTEAIANQLSSGSVWPSQIDVANKWSVISTIINAKYSQMQGREGMAAEQIKVAKDLAKSLDQVNPLLNLLTRIIHD